DLQDPELNKYLSVYTRGSNDISHIDRNKILKLLWDAVGSEFGGRHELYEINYAGNQDDIRTQCLGQLRASGKLGEMVALVDK
ncbi:4-hydroxyphenylacetate 3-hydroxylase C-terminal domain-containing protein, partial [Micrococcus luteus]|nr:4-hydroxyphenylacetate 3-hydroxylase C-terminal domain-containing protein [Micrococcus luteus]